MAGYSIGSTKGKSIASSMKSGSTYKASDGSTWSKNSNGSVSVTTKNGGYTANALGGSSTPASATPKRTPVAARDKTGATISGAYIENGKTYFGNGTRISEGTTVIDDSGREWVKGKGASGGTLTENDYGINTTNGSGTNSKANTSTYNSTTDTYDTDIQSKIDALSEAQRQSQMTALSKARDNALSSLDSSVSTINNNYYGKRNQAAAQNDVSKMNFAQYMASRGVQGNAGAMPEMYSNAGLQNQIGALNTQQASDLTGVETSRNNIESNYQSDMASAAADIEATKLQNHITQMNADRTYNTEQAATAKNDYNNSVYAYSNDFQAEINRLTANGASADDYRIKALQAARAQKLAEQEAAAAAAQQQEFENQLKADALAIKQQQADYSTSKPYYKPASSATKKYSASEVKYALENEWIDEATARAMLGY